MFQGTPADLFSNDKLLEKAELDCPSSFYFAKKLKDRGLILDLAKIKNVETLGQEISKILKAGVNNE